MRRFPLVPSLIVLITIAGLLVIGVLIRRNLIQLESLRDDAARVEHTLRVQGAVDGVLVALAEAESRQLGFLLSGVDSYLASYRAQRTRLEDALANLNALVQDNAAQRERFQRLREATAAKLALLDQGVEARRQAGLNGAAATIPRDGLRPIMIRVQALAREMLDEETQRLERRRAQAALAYRQAVGGRVASGVLSAALLVGVVLLASARSSARERAARQVADEREHLRVTLGSIGDGVIATDLSGRITLMNVVAAGLTGWTPYEAIGRRVDEVFHVVSETTGERLESPVDRVLREGRLDKLSGPTLLVGRDGVARPVEDSGAPIRAVDGEIRGAVLVFRDVSDRRRQEQALRDSDRLHREAAEREQAARTEAETANRLKDEFLAVLSHELRTPLNAVLGWTQILQGVSVSEATVARGLASIKRNADAQQRLVEDLLDVSRIITRKFPIDRRPVELRAVVGAAVDSVRPAATSKGIQLRAEFDGPALANADPHRVQQLASNLLSNAVKFTPAGGEIDVTLTTERDWVALRVCDTGEGIAPNLRPHIFDRFRQGDGSSTRAHGGLGLGLAIARHIAQAHGGSIEAESEGEGRGATFSVRLPIGEAGLTGADAASARVGFSAMEDQRLDGVTALVVDDELDTRDLLTYALQAAGVEVLAVPSAEGALEILNGRRPSVILSDLQMPEMDGFGLLRAVQERLGGLAPPTIAITARAKINDTERVARAGFAAHVAKPVDLNQLITTIRTVTGSRAT